MNNGSLEYHPERQAWVATLRPDVADRFRKVFSRVGQPSNGCYAVSNTAEICFDLQWFDERYPLEMSTTQRAFLKRQADEFSEQSRLIDQLLKGTIEPVNFELAKPARIYQRISAQLTLTLTGLLNADETGIGKTISGICCFKDPRTLPAVVVTLTDCTRQWEERIQEFAPELSTHILKGTTPYDLTGFRAKVGAQPSFRGALPNVIILNYSKLATWAPVLAKFARLVIWDEVQELRTGPGTLRYAGAEMLADATDFRLGLSNTPIYNYGDEFYNIYRCIKPRALGTRQEFLTEWCNGAGPQIARPVAFGEYLKASGLMIRRSAKEVGRELPGNGRPLVIPQHIDADMTAFNAVNRSCIELAKIILSRGPGKRGEKRAAARKFNMQLRKATGVAKAPFVADFIRLMVESGERPVVFGWHHDFYDILLDRLKDLNPVMHTGLQSEKQKDQAKLAFISGESPIFICSLRAGVGIDGLQAASRIVITGELDFCPAIHHQNIRRVYRDGQADIVRAYYLISEFGSDPTVADTLQLKTQQADGILSPDEPTIDPFAEVDPHHVWKLARDFLLQTEGTLPKDIAELEGFSYE